MSRASPQGEILASLGLGTLSGSRRRSIDLRDGCDGLVAVSTQSGPRVTEIFGPTQGRCVEAPRWVGLPRWWGQGWSLS